MIFTTSATSASMDGLYEINGSGLTVASNNYMTTILQDPGNAAALTIQGIPSQSTQSNGEAVTEAGEGALDQEQNGMSSRPNELGIVSVDIVSDDLSDGKNDQLADQLCVLGAAEAANAPGCIAQQQNQGR